MGVEMTWKSGAGAAADVIANIETLSASDLAKESDTVTKGFGHLDEFGIVEVGEFGLVGGESDEEMAVGIRESIHHDECVLVSPDDEVFSVILRFVPISTKKTSRVVGLGSEGANIFHSPRSPEVFVAIGHRLFARFSNGKIECSLAMRR